MKVTVVVTVLNNGDTVAMLVESLLAQTRKADEIIFVDGNSSDQTVEVLRGYEKKHDNFRIISQSLNKPRSRNIGIQEAKYKIIAQTDGSCVADHRWLEYLLEPMKDKKVGVSAGFYDIVAKNKIAKAVTPYIGLTPKKLDPRSYMPTGRSMAIRKKIWRRMGGYSEELQWSGEDNLFNYKLLKRGVTIARVPHAFVYWHAPDNIKSAFKKLFSYSAGIAQTRTWAHPSESLATVRANVFSVYAKYALGGILFALSLLDMFFFYLLLLGFVVYFFNAYTKKSEEVTDQSALMIVPCIQILSDIAIMTGFISGFLAPKARR